VQKQKDIDLSAIIEAERLKPEETRRFVSNAFRDGALKTTGTDIDKILPPVSRFGGAGRAEKNSALLRHYPPFLKSTWG